MPFPKYSKKDKARLQELEALSSIMRVTQSELRQSKEGQSEQQRSERLERERLKQEQLKQALAAGQKESLLSKLQESARLDLEKARAELESFNSQRNRQIKQLEKEKGNHEKEKARAETALESTSQVTEKLAQEISDLQFNLIALGVQDTLLQTTSPEKPLTPIEQSKREIKELEAQAKKEQEKYNKILAELPILKTSNKKQARKIQEVSDQLSKIIKDKPKAIKREVEKLVSKIPEGTGLNKELQTILKRFIDAPPDAESYERIVEIFRKMRRDMQAGQERTNEKIRELNAEKEREKRKYQSITKICELTKTIKDTNNKINSLSKKRKHLKEQLKKEPENESLKTQLSELEKERLTLHKTFEKAIEDRNTLRDAFTEEKTCPDNIEELIITINNDKDRIESLEDELDKIETLEKQIEDQGGLKKQPSKKSFRPSSPFTFIKRKKEKNKSTVSSDPQKELAALLGDETLEQRKKEINEEIDELIDIVDKNEVELEQAETQHSEQCNKQLKIQQEEIDKLIQKVSKKGEELYGSAKMAQIDTFEKEMESSLDSIRATQLEVQSLIEKRGMLASIDPQRRQEQVKRQKKALTSAKRSLAWRQFLSNFKMPNWLKKRASQKKNQQIEILQQTLTQKKADQKAFAEKSTKIAETISACTAKLSKVSGELEPLLQRQTELASVASKNESVVTGLKDVESQLGEPSAVSLATIQPVIEQALKAEKAKRDKLVDKSLDDFNLDYAMRRKGKKAESFGDKELELAEAITITLKGIQEMDISASEKAEIAYVVLVEAQVKFDNYRREQSKGSILGALKTEWRDFRGDIGKDPSPLIQLCQKHMKGLDVLYQELGANKTTPPITLSKQFNQISQSKLETGTGSEYAKRMHQAPIPTGWAVDKSPKVLSANLYASYQQNIAAQRAPSPTSSTASSTFSEPDDSESTLSDIAEASVIPLSRSDSASYFTSDSEPDDAPASTPSTPSVKKESPRLTKENLKKSRELETAPGARLISAFKEKTGINKRNKKKEVKRIKEKYKGKKPSQDKATGMETGRQFPFGRKPK